jgi:hypothetical protein
MKKYMGMMAVAALLGTLVPAALGQAVDPGVPVGNDSSLSLNIFGRGQLLSVLQNVPDPIRDNNRAYMFLKESRFGVKGAYADAFKYEAQLAFGGEDANGSNTDMSLLDFYADVPLKFLGDDTSFKFGQFRVPYGREGLTDTGYMDFGARSIASMPVYQDRDYGMALQGKSGNWVGTIGTWSGGARNVPQRYLPERLGVPELVARVGYDDGVDQDAYHVKGVDLDVNRTVKAAYLNALYTHDTQIGHSTALGVKTIVTNLMTDANYNPFLKSAGGTTTGSGDTLQRGDYWALGGDAVIRHPLGNGQTVAAEIQGDWTGFQNRFGVIHMASGRVQGDYEAGPFGIGLRYAVLALDKKAGPIGYNGNYGGFGQKLINEITPALAWHVKGHNLKVVADLPIYPDCPVFVDPAIGSYAFPDPTATDQNTSAHPTARKTVTEARLLLQFMF